jgi:hypothetical protein
MHFGRSIWIEAVGPKRPKHLAKALCQRIWLKHLSKAFGRSFGLKDFAEAIGPKHLGQII